MTKAMTNLRQMKGSKKKPASGDIFVMQLPDERYIFGRVVGADLAPPLAPMPLSYLIYVYDVVSGTPAPPPVRSLTPDRLLVPPTFINQMPWSKGYFQTVASEPIAAPDLLRQHCFFDAARRRFVDEQQSPLPAESQPCGVWGLASYRLLDDLVSDALGIPRVPEDA
ncbi:immunity 26/phosphotriesterase HocA family protein [Nocardioides maradonensis]